MTIEEDEKLFGFPNVFSMRFVAVFLSRILGLFFFLIWCTNEDLIVYKLFDKFFVGQIFKLLYFAQWILISS